MKFDYLDEDGRVLTSVSVNPLTKRVKVVNYTQDIMDRAFGAKENVTYQDVIDFFEKRTFPRNRTDLPDILAALGLKRYDPYLMCRKLKGRREQDRKWIDFLTD